MREVAMSRPTSVTLRKLIRKLKPRKQTALVRVEDIRGRQGRDQRIPRVVFQTTESRWVHPAHFKSISQFREANDDLDFFVFDKEERDAYMESQWGSHRIFDVYNRSLFGQMKADIFRYCIVFDKGGYYVDFNKGVEGRITDFHPADSAGLVSYESNPELIFPDEEVATQLQNPFNLLMQWAFGFSPNHPFLEMVINRIVQIEPYFRDKTFKYPKSALLTLSAPGVFTRVFREYVGLHGLDGITEAGEDFFGKGIFRLRGSKYLWKEGEHYSSHRDKPLILSPSSLENT